MNIREKYLYLIHKIISAATRGKDVEGAVPKDTLVIFAIGG